MTKFYFVTCRTKDDVFRKSYVNGLILAKNKIDAIKSAIQYIRNEVLQYPKDYQIIVFKNKIEIKNQKNKVIEKYYDFKAEIF